MKLFYSGFYSDSFGPFKHCLLLSAVTENVASLIWDFFSLHFYTAGGSNEVAAIFLSTKCTKQEREKFKEKSATC